MKQSIFRKLSLFLLILSLVMMGMIGCSTDQGKPEQSASGQLSNPQTTAPTENNQTKENAFPVTVKDGTGKEITVEKAPERIISLIPSNTEIIYALGYGDQIVGVTSNDNYPEEVKNKEKVGDMNVDLEKVVSLHPDLVLANQWHVTGQVDQVAKMREAGLNVLVVNDATSLNQVYESIRLLAKVTGTSDKGEEVIKGMQERYRAVVEKAKTIPADKKKKVWVEISAPPELYTTGKGTFMNELLEAAGAINVANDQEGWPKWTEEQAVAAKPDVILLTYDYVPNAVEEVKKRPAWKEVPAVKNGEIYQLNQDTVSRPGPRLMDALEEIAKDVYPDVFK
ncbi:Uncharacterized ABC transporter substrate-binding lipoprotein YvrC [[Clostridium] ultunense Esp]|nr:Uncharacterized ABC transporter substrate-binding lipoprotein YvrC [[Clostridium] ultunense Esp]